MRCRFERKIFLNEQNGYTVAVFTTQDNSVPLSARNKYLAGRGIIGFTAIGFKLPLSEQIELEMEGEWENSEHGSQFKVDNFLEIVPRTKEGIIAYLSSGAIKGVKTKTAEAIFKEFGLQTLEVMEQTPEKLLCIRGISERKLEEIKASFGQNRVFRELMNFLGPYHVTPKKANLILQKFKEESVDIIRKCPYMLCAVKGFGFFTVDEIGRQRCSSLNDPMRISGCISHVLNEALKEGHLYLDKDALSKRALEILNRGFDIPVVTAKELNIVLYRLVMQRSIALEDDCIYIAKKYEEEDETARMIARRLLQKSQSICIDKELEEAQKDLEIQLSEKQKQAVQMVFENNLSIITGGPGTGKTTVLKVILYIYQRLYKEEIQLMAPTGRAARRMVESTGYPDASTMHMALGLVGDASDYVPISEELSAGFLNVDEVSMVDMHLAHEFFQRVKEDAKILLVGDVNQLPSVGAGDVFRQLIACGLIPVTVLDMVYRQGERSSIAVNAHLMQEGKTTLVKDKEFVFLSCSGAEETAEKVKEIYQKELQKQGLDQVQILTPYRKRSAAGVEELNRTLQDIINPLVSGEQELAIGNHIFRKGDKIIQNKNTELVSNGDMGIIQEFFEDEEGILKVKLLFSDNRKVEYEQEQMEMIEHANATTIHKSQGSEWSIVIIPWVKAFYMMLKRNILYTGITRAKTKVYLVGEWSAVCQAIKTDDTGKRNSNLSKKIRMYFESSNKKTDVMMEQLKLVI